MSMYIIPRISVFFFLRNGSIGAHLQEALDDGVAEGQHAALHGAAQVAHGPHRGCADLLIFENDTGSKEKVGSKT